jgi:hypothetical protein
MGSPVPFATVCIGLNTPTDLHARLLRRLVDAGDVAEVNVGRIRLTTMGVAQVAAQRA